MKNQDLFLWGVQSILSSGVMQSAEIWTIRKLSLEAITASKNIPSHISIEEAVDAFYLHILSVKNGNVSEFAAW